MIPVLSVSSGDNPYVAFQHETARRDEDGNDPQRRLAQERTVEAVDLVIAQGKVEGIDPDDLRDADAGRHGTRRSFPGRR